MGLSIKSSTYLYWLLSFVSLVVILMSVYYYMGGFDEVKTYKSDGSNYAIVGKWLRGEVARKEEAVLFNEVRDKLIRNKLSGTLCMVDYASDTLTKGEINRFVGILLNNTVSAIPSGYTVLELSDSVTFRAALTMHPLVMPNSRKVRQLLETHAARENEVLDSFTIEHYYVDNSVMVEVFTR